MEYLFGDSTPSPFQVNVLGLVRGAVECCVELLLADHAIGSRDGERAARRRAADVDVERIESLRDEAQRAVGPVARAPGDDPATRCANAMDRAIADVARDAIAEVRRELDLGCAELDREDGQDRDRAAAALDRWLRAWDLPEAARTTHLEALGEAGYRAEVRETTPYGVGFEAAIVIPDSSPFAASARVGAFDEAIEVSVTEQAGWFRKSPREVARRLDGMFIAELTVDPARAVLRVRATPSPADAGFDIAVDRDGGALELSEVPEGGGSPARCEVSADQVGRLRALVDAAVAAADALVEHREAIRQVTLDGEPVADYAALAARIIAAIAPTVREIEQRSLSPKELVLRRSLGADRREEIFLAKRDLVAALAPLPRALRPAFAALGIADAGEVTAESAEPSVPPPPPGPERDVGVPHEVPSDPSVQVYEHDGPDDQASGIEHVGIDDAPPRPDSEPG